MNRLLKLLLSLIFLLTACGKSKKDSTNPITEPCQSYKTIYYKDYNPDILCTDSLFYLDMNNDSIMDIKIVHNYWFEYSGPHPLQCFSIWMVAYDSLKLFTKHPSCNPTIDCIQYCDSTEFINKNDSVSNAFCLAYGSIHMYCNCLGTNNFIGFSLMKNGKKYIGWIRLCVPSNVLKIDDYATLESSCDSIKFGMH
jgi:hypothetical protein